MAHQAHRRPTGSFWRRHLTRVVVPTLGIGVLAVGAAVVVPDEPVEAVQAQAQTDPLLKVSEEPTAVSRGGERAVLEQPAVAASRVQAAYWVTADTEIRADASADAVVLGSVPEGQQVPVTGVVEGEWTQVMHNDLPRWVDSAALSETEPVGQAPCPNGSSIENGLQPDTVKVYRAVCAKFPSISNYGGRGGGGEHATGQALDIMVSSDLGDQIAAYLQDNAARLGISQLIWRQRIWTVQLAGSGWRSMEDRGSATANHFDHVHVTTYGSRAR